MNYYFLFLVFFYIITFIFIKFSSFTDVKTNKRYLIFIFVSLFLFLALKSNDTGVDATSYQKIFKDINETPFFSVYAYDRYEIGFKYFCKIISLIWNNYTFFSIIVSFIELAGFYYLIKKYSKNYVFSLFIFITYDTYIFTFGILRQAIALSILLISIKFIKENKFLKFLSLVLLASTFHKTALLFIVCYFIKNVKLNKKIMIGFSVITLFTMLFGDLIIKFILAFVYKPANTTFYSGGGYKLLILIYTTCLISYYLRDKIKLKDENNLFLINILMYATIIQSLAPTFQNVGRLTIYFFPILNILITGILEYVKDKRINFLLFVLLTVYFHIETSQLSYHIFFWS